MVLEIKKIESLSDLSELKKQYFESSTAALDGMWHFGFVPMSRHFGFYNSDKLVGYCCVNDDAYMLQFYLLPTCKLQEGELFKMLTKGDNPVIGNIKGAFVSTAETNYLSLCFDNSSSFKVNSIMYQESSTYKANVEKLLDMKLAIQEQLDTFVDFAAINIGAPKEWLNYYFSNLIKRKELWGYWDNDTLLASGECRFFDEYQTDYAELGMIVAESQRGKGIATQVLQFLSKYAKEKELHPICSTESTNIAAQKAIAKAGLVSLNRIIQFEFDSL
ncbi:GNAT family N-acetyltransferase [Francisellaceae bacterium CB300]